MAVLAIDYKTGLNNAWSNIATFIPKLVVFLIILVVGYFVAKAIAQILTRVLQKVGFDNLVERGGVKTALAKSEYDAAGVLSKVVFYAIMLFVLSTAFGVFGTNPISGYLHSVIAYLPLVFIAIVILVIGFAIAAAAKALNREQPRRVVLRHAARQRRLHRDHRLVRHRRAGSAAHRAERRRRPAVRHPGGGRRGCHRCCRRRWHLHHERSLAGDGGHL